jgi:hypothetical protein
MDLHTQFTSTRVRHVVIEGKVQRNVHYTFLEKRSAVLEAEIGTTHTVRMVSSYAYGALNYTS